MRFLISNELAIQYNLFGHHGKKRFRDLRLFDVICGKCVLLFNYSYRFMCKELFTIHTYGYYNSQNNIEPFGMTSTFK